MDIKNHSFQETPQVCAVPKQKLVSLFFISAALISPLASAVDLNYESLSSLEEPLAFEYADVTFSVNGLFDASSIYRDSDDDTDYQLLGNFQINAETQLSNSWTLGAAYFGEGSDDDGDYEDNIAAYLSGVWGTVSVGNVSELVREQARRRRGVGNAELNFDDRLGQLGDYGITYIGRFGPAQLLATFDQDGGYEVGGTYQRPMGNKDYRFAIRYRDTEYNFADNLDFSGMSSFDFASLESKSLGFVSELTYGSLVFDAELGFEQLSNSFISLDRKYVSLGASRKIGRLAFSAEAHFGDIEGQSETSYAAGVAFDVARGLSLNFGLNHSDAQVDVNGISILDNDDTEVSVSLRYSF